MTAIYWLGRATGVVAVVIAVLSGSLRDLWWLWLAFWVGAEITEFASERLIYWQRRHIASLGRQIESLDDALRLAVDPARLWDEGGE